MTNMKYYNSYFLQTYQYLENNINSMTFDDIPIKLIKFCSITEILVLMIKRSLQTGVFSDKLKYSIVKLMHKKDDETIINIDKLISLLPNIYT